MMDSNITSNDSLHNVHVAFWANLSFGFVGFVLNLTVCLIISTHSILRQPFNYLILNLSITDLLVSCAAMFNSILDYFSASHLISYRASSIICHINITLAVISLPAACLTLLIMSIERYQAIAVVRLRKLHLSTVRKSIVVVWLLAIITSIIPIVYAKVDIHFPYECNVGRIDQFHLLILIIILFLITSIVPMGIMLIVYAMIFYKLIHNLSQVQPIPSLVMSNREKNLRRSIVPVLCISIFSTFSSIPYVALSYYTSINQYHHPLFRGPFVQQYYHLWILTSTLFILTPIINPLLYNLASSKFRQVLHSLLCDRCCSRCSAIQRMTTPIKPVQVEAYKLSTAHSQILVPLPYLHLTNEPASRC